MIDSDDDVDEDVIADDEGMTVLVPDPAMAANDPVGGEDFSGMQYS
jgi:hypothetical protein